MAKIATVAYAASTGGKTAPSPTNKLVRGSSLSTLGCKTVSGYTNRCVPINKIEKDGPANWGVGNGSVYWNYGQNMTYSNGSDGTPTFTGKMPSKESSDPQWTRQLIVNIGVGFHCQVQFSTYYVYCALTDSSGNINTSDLTLYRNSTTKYDIYSNSYGYMNILFSINAPDSFSMTFTISPETINNKNRMIIAIQ